MARSRCLCSHWSFPKDNDVVHQAQNTRQVVKSLVHHPLEGLWGTGDPEGHLVEAETAERGDKLR